MTTYKPDRWSIYPAMLAIALTGLAAVAATDAGTNPASAASVDLRIMRASDYLDHEVIAADGQKVGTIVDFAFSTRDLDNLGYVLVMTGGVLGTGGEVRAIPASALRFADNAARIDLNQSQFRALAVLPHDRRGFLNDSTHEADLARSFHVAARANRNGREPGSSLILFSELRNQPAQSVQGEQLGRFTDAWISLDHRSAPYLEIEPAATDPFHLPSGERYALPISKLQPEAAPSRLVFALTRDDVSHARAVNETVGAGMEQGAQIDTPVVRVRLPASAVNASWQTVDAGAAAAAVPDQVAVAPTDVSGLAARHFVGQAVRSSDGKELGTIDDFIVNADSGALACALVASGGFMGIGTKLVPVPVRALRPAAAKEGFTVAIDEAHWAEVPTLANAREANGAIAMDADAQRKLREVFGSPAIERGVRASRIRGKEVQGENRRLGDVEAVLVDLRRGSAAILLDPDKAVTGSDRKLMVPLLHVELKQGVQDTLHTDLSGAELRRVATGAQTTMTDRP